MGERLPQYDCGGDQGGQPAPGVENVWSEEDKAGAAAQPHFRHKNRPTKMGNKTNEKDRQYGGTVI